MSFVCIDLLVVYKVNFQEWLQKPLQGLNTNGGQASSPSRCFEDEGVDWVHDVNEAQCSGLGCANLELDESMDTIFKTRPSTSAFQLFSFHET